MIFPVHGIAEFLIIAGCSFVAAAGTSLFTRILHRYARRWNLLDRPVEKQKIHTEPVPTGGGLAIAGGICLGMVVLSLGWDSLSATEAPLFWVSAILMLGTGLWDDKYGLDVKGKFLLQAIAAYLLLHAGFYIEVGEFSFSTGGEFEQALYSIPLSLIWIVGIINAVNLTDGTDGVAVGILAIAFLACATLLGIKGHMAPMGFGVVVAGALIGFLPYNFNPASIFMGDSGSLFLGCIISAYSLQYNLHSDPVISFAILTFIVGVPVLDTAAATFRRLASSSRNVFAPDTNHIHHRLTEHGSERSAALTLYIAEGWFGSAAILMGVLPSSWGYAIAVGTVGISIGWVWQLGCLQPVPTGQKSEDGKETTAASVQVEEKISQSSEVPSRVQGKVEEISNGNTLAPRGR